jgi:hypothetical protein
MPITIHRGRILGDVAFQIARLEKLASDLDRLGSGIMPSAAELADAPLIDQYMPVTQPVPCLAGVCSDHPRLHGPLIMTTDIWVAAFEDGWVRTLGRYYRLGQPRS